MTIRTCQWLAPFLVALHLPLFIFARNSHLLVVEEMYPPAGTAILAAGLLAAAIYAVTRDRARTVCLATGAMAWLSWYGIFSGGLATHLGVGRLAGGVASATLIPWTGLWLLYTVSAIRARSLEARASAWLLAALVLAGQPLYALGTFVVQRPDDRAPLPMSAVLQPPAARPDIVHLVFDRYASASVLRDRYAFDNSGLINGLRARGFVVAERSNANYFRTGLSLAATLNLTYLNDRFAGLEGASDWRPVYRLLHDHSVWRSLQSLGYEYVQMGSWWEPTRHNPHATENRSYARIPMLAHLLYRGTPLADMGLWAGGALDARRDQWLRIRRQLQDLETIRADRPPLFIFGHFLLPHDPYVFGSGGEFLPEAVVRTRRTVENYVNQVRFANTAILRLVDALLADTTRPAPILILQADEGPYPPRYEANSENVDWRQATDEEVREKFGILNAMYLPGVRPRGLHTAITPVNTYRVIFNEYFGTRLDLLPDRSFLSVSERKPYQFIDVTDVITAD